MFSNGQVQRDLNIRNGSHGRTLIAVAIAAAALRVVPAFPALYSDSTQSATVYRYGNEYVQFSGQQAFIGFGNQIYPVSWSVVKIGDPQYSPASSGGSGTHSEKFSHFSNKRIDNKYQNSAVLLMNNSEVRIAEIYSFLPDGVDASIAVENVGNSSSQFLVGFALKTHYHQHAGVNGFYPADITTSRGIGNAATPINTNDWTVSTGNVSVDWKSEASIFHAGILAQSLDSNSNVIDLVFGSLNIAVNDTYSVDPIIRPDLLPPPPGGGGGGPSPSLISSVSYSFSGQGSTMSIPAETPISISIDLSTMGGYNPVNVKIFAVDNHYYFNQIGSVNRYSTGTFTFDWYSQPGAYIGFAAWSSGGITVASGYYPTSSPLLIYTLYPESVGAYLQEYPDTVSSGIYYDSNGNHISTVSGSSAVQDTLDGKASIYLELASGLYNYKNNISVWADHMGIAWKGNSAGATPATQSGYMTNALVSYTHQGDSNDGANGTAYEMAIWDALAAGAGFASIIASSSLRHLLWRCIGRNVYRGTVPVCDHQWERC